MPTLFIQHHTVADETQNTMDVINSICKDFLQWELLRELAPLTGHGVYVFPGMRDHARPMSEAAVNAALHAMDYKGRHCWHGYRASGRTILRQVLKYPADVIEAQMAHKGQITHGGAYDRATFIDERAAMLQVWADYLDKLQAGADVIELPKRSA